MPHDDDNRQHISHQIKHHNMHAHAHNMHHKMNNHINNNDANMHQNRHPNIHDNDANVHHTASDSVQLKVLSLNLGALHLPKTLLVNMDKNVIFPPSMHLNIATKYMLKML